ncbi:relaxase/mobilization nuclease domain-containing protein [Marinilongibacter aquaticus]|uniref:relaxase/mobilization nuclease domain-containing protein n=1 Tax=Marinilongibacter aquaticus TaxID=2975157 RepID=UPI0021BD2482|nr:relaxase/mobilization nuclease domain-containing protein [Marinilongibacter aquaticus]UBM58815.1 relaxase/mobilization nuclease domain-containing protein [Marinilongibacter aquaticus]
MVAVIKTGYSIHRMLSYNENKVRQGLADCIGAGNYPLDPVYMDFGMKIARFLKRMELNGTARRTSVHVSLNFDVSESHFSDVKMLEIAEGYLQRIGFGEQPYLVYRHNDAGHPHVHLVTTNIGTDGRRIDLHHLAIRKSEPARKALEEEFGLVRAQVSESLGAQRSRQVPPIPAKYGKSQTKRTIQNILDAVIPHYRYSSLPELNAVLSLYNVRAERGMENSRVYRTGGLFYRVLDSGGDSVGVPLKASLFYNKPTLRYLEMKFAVNASKRKPFGKRIRNEIDRALLSGEVSMQGLERILAEKAIALVKRHGTNGVLYGITYVDHRTKCVFKGSDLGKAFSAGALMGRCSPASPSDGGFGWPFTGGGTQGEYVSRVPDVPAGLAGRKEGVLEVLARAEQVPEPPPAQFRRKRKKRTRSKFKG